MNTLHFHDPTNWNSICRVISIGSVQVAEHFCWESLDVDLVFSAWVCWLHIYKVWTAVDITGAGETAAAEMSYQDGLNLTPKQRGGT